MDYKKIATRVLMKWLDNGEDVYVNFPCLSTYT